MFMWGQFISLCRPRGCTPIPLILFPVPLALRWYLRSLVFIIVCLCLPAQIPPLSSGSLPPPCADIVTLTLPQAHAHAHKHVSPAHSPRLGAVSFTSVLHPRTNSNLEQGGRGWIYTTKRRPQATLRLDPLAVQRPQARRLRSRE